ncbi:MAG: SPOR domain-containing protein [Gallionellaceae bacterium]|nr:SPOR domain-containing protein [Gallionellaceae bacterium]
MARRETRSTQREEPKRGGGKPGGLFLGLLLGLVVGLVAAAGLAWYFNLTTGEFKTVEQAPKATGPVQPIQPDRSVEPVKKAPPPAREAIPPPLAPPPPKPVEAKPVEAKPEKPAKTSKGGETAAPIVERKPARTNEPTARVPLTFYGILPGEKPAKPVEPPKPTELWWLQVAALKSSDDADKLKARLSLLGLVVTIQQVESAGLSLYRVRVGPYKRDEDAFADLDTLAANNYEPRLFKEPVKP